MGLFSKKKGEDKGKKEKRLVPIEMRRRVVLPPSGTFPKISSREYRIFKEERKRGLSWYERLARLAGKFLNVNVGGKTGAGLKAC